MKKQLKKVAFVAAIVLVCGTCFLSSQKSETLSEVALANVEALASFVVNTDICMSFPGKDCAQLITTPSGSYYEIYPDQINKTF